MDNDRHEERKNMKINIIVFLGLFIFTTVSFSQTIYPNNEDGPFEDMLTPQYYLSANGTPFRDEVNKFVYFRRMEQCHHPLENSIGEIPHYSIPAMGEFGAGKGPTGTAQHHAALDFHVGHNETNVTMYAAHDGYVAVYRDAPKYRNYLSITKNIADSTGAVIGKMVTLYAHIDLDLDAADNILLDGHYVKQGAIVSTHLYSGTMGGPHLHFEIRYYRPADVGDEELYGFVGPQGSVTLTEHSAGSWLYGYWNPDIGYGFANPENHVQSATGVPGRYAEMPGRFELFQNYPNPFNPATTITFFLPTSDFVKLVVSNSRGQEIGVLVNNVLPAGFHKIVFDAVDLKSGLYFYTMSTGEFSMTKKFVIIR